MAILKKIWQTKNLLLKLRCEKSVAKKAQRKLRNEKMAMIMEEFNPFLVSGYVSPEYFCDREEETKKLSDALSNGRNVTLVSTRRMGKTGLIKHVFYKLKKQKKAIKTFYMDIYSTQNLNGFVNMFANLILGQFDSPTHKVLKTIAQFIKSCRLALGIDEVTGKPKIIVEVAPNSEQTTLKEIFDYIKASGKRCYIAIDEFQQIGEYPEKGVEALLRSYIQFIPNANFIFAGSKQHVMFQMFMSAKRPFYQSTQMLVINTINKEKYYTFAKKFFNQKSIKLSHELFNSIYDRFEGHTWYIQAILNRLYNYGQEISTILIQRAIDSVIEEFSYYYETVMTTLPKGCAGLLRAIAKEKKVKAILSGEFIAKHGLVATSSVKGSLSKLIDNELICKDIQDNTATYRVSDRFMSEWLSRKPY